MTVIDKLSALLAQLKAAPPPQPNLFVKIPGAHRGNKLHHSECRHGVCLGLGAIIRQMKGDPERANLIPTNLGQALIRLADAWTPRAPATWWLAFSEVLADLNTLANPDSCNLAWPDLASLTEYAKLVADFSAHGAAPPAPPLVEAAA